MAVEHLDLPEHEMEYVRRCVSEGRYGDEREVVLAGLHLLERQETSERAKLERLRAEVQKGMDDLENGRYTEINSKEELDAFMDEIDREAEAILAEERRRVSAPEV